jgi:hypothetical protein
LNSPTTEITLFLGKPVEYWITLQTRVERDDLTSLVQEIAQLSAKVYRYEKLIDTMAAVRSELDRRFS